MALTPIVAHKKQLAAKIESVPGTAEVLANTDATDRVINPVFEDITEKVRERRNLTGWHPGVLGVKFGRITFEVEAYAGSATPRLGATYLAACGLGNTTSVYRRDSRHILISASTVKTLTMGFYQDGTFNQIHGAMGNCVISGEAGKVGRLKFTFSGVYTPMTDVALLSVTYATPALLRLQEAAFSIGALSPKISKFELDLGNEVEPFLDANAVGGCAYWMISDHQAKLTVDPIMGLVAEEDIYSLFEDGTESAINIALKNGSDSMTIAFTKGEVISLSRQERSKLAAWNLVLGDNAADLNITFATGT